MVNNIKNKQGGFLKLIIFIVIVLLLMRYFHVTITDILNYFHLTWTDVTNLPQQALKWFLDLFNSVK